MKKHKAQPMSRLPMPEKNTKKLSRSKLDATTSSYREFILPPYFLIVIVLGFIVISILKLVDYQIKYNSVFSKQAQSNQLRETYSSAPRGLIYDVNNKVLVSNKTLAQVSLVPALWTSDKARCVQNLSEIARLTDQSPKYILDLIKKHDGSLEPRVLIQSVDRQRTIVLSQLQSVCPALNLEPVISRDYIKSRGLSHVLGYVGQPTSEDLAKDDNLRAVDLVGRTGLEAYYDDELRGDDGVERVRVDALGTVVQTLSSLPAEHGKDIKLNLDLELQTSLYSALSKELRESGAKRGSVIALNPKTGGIMAMVDLPEFDNNIFTHNLSQITYDRLLNDPNRPLVDSAVSGNFPAGSVVKPILGAAALQEGVVTPDTQIFDGGYIDIKNVYDPSIVYRYHGWDHTGLGSVDLVQAIALSSDIYFYTVGGGYGNQAGLGASRIAKYYRMFGLGQKTGIDLPLDSTGYVPEPKNGKTLAGNAWTIGDTYNISIGQGDLQVSPLQMILAETAIINGGKLLKPQLVYSIDGKSVGQQTSQRVDVNEANLAVSRLGMEAVIKTFRSGVFSDLPVQVAGKTGTAETTKDAKPHAWFIGYAPAKNPEIVIAVFVDHGGEGSQVAAPVAATGLKTYFTNNK